MTATGTALFAGIGPDLYRDNPFRVTGLPVDATDRDIRRRAEELRVRARFGDGSSPGSPLLPLDPPPGADAVQEAFQRLRDPLLRLADELFWFWPSRANGDEALDALREGRAEDAERLWSEPGPGRPAAVAAHNLAVLAHARALDSGDLGDERWDGALRGWRAVLDTDAFWDLVAARARAAADPRVTPDMADELRERLPAAVLAVSAALAVRAASSGAHDQAAAHVRLMRGAGFDAEAVDAALSAAAAPEASRLRSSGDDALDRASADPETGYGEAVRLAERAEPVFAGLAAVLPAGHPVLAGLRDEVAGTVMRCAVRYINETEDWGPAEGVLERAEAMADSPNVRADVAENLRIVRDNLVYGTCWFCGDQPSGDRSGVEVPMHGDVKREMTPHYTTRITWRKLTITVPRCAGCASAHRKRRAKVWALALGADAAVFALACARISAGSGLGVLFMALAVIGLPFAIGYAATSALPGEAKRVLHGFPAVREKFDAGWQPGAKPPGVQ
ncbi:hypothetical protein [Actinomadura chibensis]|uniref:Uncharacterized protein n=1 Tax=Actinomadura chibensis TaxID=392828 RepID=A0A5D0NIQ4_9ACTN|nr:hypothetical protein [Actinomadura chibensis]TYB44262.1 hypothetical protein FXF69_25300 [Actinomadura chibensis]